MEFSDGYDGVTVAGVAYVAADTGRVFLAQRALDETDDESVQETWEFPGGHLMEGEDPQEAAYREFFEEIGVPAPIGEVVAGWRAGDDGHYQGFVVVVPTEEDLSGWEATAEVQDVEWFNADGVEALRSEGELRPELANDMDWNLVWGAVSGNDGSVEAAVETAIETDPAVEEAEPEFDAAAFTVRPIPIHGVMAPEETESGDQRGFVAGAVTTRPLRIPFRWQKSDIGGHDGAVVVGSVDRLMRIGGNIHWEGLLMASPEASELTDLIEFFGKFGTSIDGDKGALAKDRTNATGVTWFEAARAAGLTAVAIPAFHEAYVALGPSPYMPAEEDADETTMALTAGACSPTLLEFKRGKGWVTNPKETSRLHRYWTEKGQPGYAKVAWGTPGDWRRAKALIGEKIAKNSPDKMRYLNQIISQWHFDALGYWPGDLDKPGNKTSAQAKAERKAKVAGGGDPAWEAVLVSSAGNRVLPPSAYFDRHEDTDALVIEEPDASGIRRTYGYAGEWGVCHIGYNGRCVEAPSDPSGEYAQYHLGVTKTSDAGALHTGLITYKVGHRGAEQILSESAEEAHFDDIKNAWAAVRLGEDERGIWFSGVVLPHVSNEDLTLIEASGQVSGEWTYGALRTLLTVNVPGFPVVRSSAAYDDDGEVVALAASAFGTSECEPTPAERMAALRQADAEARFENLRERWV